MKINFRRFMAMMLAVLMVFGTFSTLATAADTATADACADGKHNWIQLGDDETAIVDPTCTKEGYTWYYCVDCNAKDIQDIKAALGHDWVGSRVEPTCVADGEYIETCSRCGETQNEEVLEPKDNIFVGLDGTETTKPGYVLPNGIEVAGHYFEYVLDPSTPNPKCGEVAVYWLTCTNHGANPTEICGYVEDGPIYLVTPHNYVDYSVEKEPTCYEFGIMRFECDHDGCEEYIAVKIEKTAHDLVDHEGKAPTCTEGGWADYQTCKNENCDYTTYDAIDALGHDPVETVYHPSCTEDGYIVVTCSRDCGYEETKPGVPALDHDWGNWYVVDEATCTEEGLEQRDCQRGDCTAYETRATDALGHDPVTDAAVDPTCHSTGLTEGSHCDRCGEVLEAQEEVPMTDHEWGEWRCIDDGTCKAKSTWRRDCAAGCFETEERDYGTHPVKNRLNYEEFAKYTDNDDINDKTNATYVDNECWIRYDCELCGLNDIEEKVDHRDVDKGIVVEEATCNATGRYADHCLSCGNWTFYSMPIEDHDQKEVPLAAVAPTCTETGLTAGSYCDNCGLTIVAQEVVPAKGHAVAEGETYDEYVAPTCEDEGYWKKNCVNGCGVYYEEGKIPAAGHDYSGTPATCVDPQVCAVDGCGKILVEAKGHTEGAAVQENYVAPDCITAGSYDSVVYCSVEGCGVELSRTNVPVDPVGHTPGEPVEENYVANTCVYDGGYDVVVYCSVKDCGAEISREHVVIPANSNAHPVDNHEWAYFVITKDPTCTVGGEATVYCDMCDGADEHKLSYYDEGIHADLKAALAPTGHEDLEDCDYTKVEPTCQEEGYESWVCHKCDTEIKRVTIEIDPDAHPARQLRYHDEAIMVDGKGYVRTPSCAADGMLWYYCEACAAVDPAYQGFTVTETGSKMNCHDDVANLTLDTEKSYAATCTEDGLSVYYCKHPHEIVYWDSTAGMYLRDTRYCTYTTEVVEPATDHAFGYLAGYTYPTCTEDAVVEAYCNNCGHRFTLEEFAEYSAVALGGMPIYKLGHNEYTLNGYAATCEDPGLTDGVACSRCRVVLTKQEEIPALGHDWSEWTYQEGEFCTDDTAEKRVCQRTACGCEEFRASTHDYVGVVTDPTCMDGGYTTYTCSKCKDSYVDDRVGALGHDMGEYYETKAPTCTEYGEKQSDCSRCDYFETAPIDPLDHTYDEDVTAPTCTDDGYITITCARCDYEDKKAGEPATGHKMGDWIVDSDSDCVNAGSKHRDCLNGCGLTETEAIPAKGHTPAEMLLGYMCGDDEDCPNGHNFKAPTCEEPGVAYGRICTVCKSCVNEEGVDHVEIPALGGKCNFEEFVVPVGCENYGFTYTICVQCGDGYGVETELRPDGKIWNDAGEAVEGIITDYKPATGHDMQPVDKELGGNGDYGYLAPTCTTPGWEAQYCANGCGLIENKVDIPALGHDAPNHKDADGNHVGEEVDCARCGETIPGHRDAEGNSMFEYRTDVEVTLGENDECIKTCYLIAYCPDKGCEYKKVENIWLQTDENGDPDFDHDMVPDEEYNEAHKGDELKGGEYKEVCANGCGHYTIESYDAELDGEIIFDSDIYGSYADGEAVYGENMIVNGGYMAVKIKMSAANVNIWGISFDLSFDNDKFVFEKDLTAAANADNGFVNDYNAVGSTLRVMSTYETADGSLENYPFTGLDVEYLTLIFSVKSTAYDAEKVSISSADGEIVEFAFVRTEVIDKDKNAPVNGSIFNELGEIVVWKAANLDDNAAFGLGDANELMQLITNSGYDVRADIDMDGEVWLDDFRAIKKIQMNDGLVYGIYEDILDGYIVA